MPHKGFAEDTGENSPEPLPEEEPFEDADVNDEDYNPYQDSEDEEEEPDEKIIRQTQIVYFLIFFLVCYYLVKLKNTYKHLHYLL